MSTIDPATHPFLGGPFAPTQSELEDAPVELIAGALPDDLAGTYYRNGPNPRFTPIGSYTYPLDGDGMVHAVRIGDGKATYGNRYVRTPSLAAEERAGRALWGGVMTPILPSAEDAGPEMAGQYKDLPDINVVHHGGRLLALAEGARPFALDARLGTVGPWYFEGRLPRGLCAHPKVDPVSGELVAFRYGFDQPYLTWAVVGRDGHVARPEQPIPVDAPYMIHDCVITPSWLVLFVCPAVFDFQGPEVLQWLPDRGTRIALVPRDGGAVRWVDAEAFWVWHFANAFEETDSSGRTSLVIDYCKWSALPLGAGGQVTGSVVRARIDPIAGRVRFATLDPRPAEFPRIDDRRIGSAHRFVYAAAKAEGSAAGQWNLVRRFDTKTGDTTTFAPGTLVGEPVFAPSRAGKGEEDGYVLAYRFAGDTTDLVVLRAADIAGTPAAVLRMPQRVPCGLHGCWVPA